MRYGRAYRKAFEAVARRINANFQTPCQAVERWQDLVNQVKNGYPFPHVELDYDLERSREPLETFLAATDLAGFKEHQTFQEIIQDLDETFRTLSVEHPAWQPAQPDFRWWSYRVLRYGSQAYADFIHAHFGPPPGVTVKVVKRDTGVPFPY